MQELTHGKGSVLNRRKRTTSGRFSSSHESSDRFRKGFEISVWKIKYERVGINRNVDK